jgi:hypothetical protein
VATAAGVRSSETAQTRRRMTITMMMRFFIVR